MNIVVRMIDALEDGHPVVSISDGTWEANGCGDTHCIGKCRLPALVLNVEGTDCKIRGSMVSYGPVVQAWSSGTKERWVGALIEVPATMHETLRQMWWK